jgi:hypothetical protein
VETGNIIINPPHALTSILEEAGQMFFSWLSVTQELASVDVMN